MYLPTIIFLDFETGSVSPSRTQPIQLSAIAIDPRKCEKIRGSEFNSYIKPLLKPEACEKEGVDPIENKALQITKIEIKTLEKAPPLNIVWKQFIDYVNQYNYKKTRWTAPVLAGFNNNNFDDRIIERLCSKFGPWDKDREEQALFHPLLNMDLLKYCVYWWFHDPEIQNVSMDFIRKYTGLPMEGGHNSLVDCNHGGDLLIKFLNLAGQKIPINKKVDMFTDFLKLSKEYGPQIKFEGCFKCVD